MRIMVVFGTRPEAIKMAPVITAIKQDKNLDLKVCVTAQHRQMLDQVLSLFEIMPDFDLNIMQPDQDLTAITSRVLQEFGRVLQEWHPDLLLVHGDTTTTMATSLAAYYEKVKVGHVEAGLRTGNIYSPWPEEMNRRITGAIANIHFAPTKKAQYNLQSEGVPKKNIYVTGNTVIDALLQIIAKIDQDTKLQQEMVEKFHYLDPKRKQILVTGHRRENFGQRFENICHALKQLGQRPDVQIIYPVHLNPNVHEPAMRILSTSANIHLVEPLDYLSFVYLMSRSYLIITDSGGVQEEAPSIGKPVLVTRDSTERPEAVEAGAVMLVGAEKNKIITEVVKLLEDQSAYQSMVSTYNPYGDGRSSIRILEIINSFKGYI